MTARAAMALVGRRGLYIDGSTWNGMAPTFAEQFRVAVTVEDVRTLWGRKQYQITPVDGSGRRWVMAEAVTLEDAKPSVVSGPRELTA